MAAGFCCITLITLLSWISGALAAATYQRIGVDMTGPGCFDNTERPLNDYVIYSLYAKYNPQVKPSLDSCDVSIRATETNRQLLYVVERLVIFDCGIEILIFDNPQLTTTPTRRITCNDDKSTPINGKSSHGVIKISMRKQSVQSAAFDFQISVKTNFGPDLDVDLKGSEFYEPPLNTGAIVGIAIAGVVLIIALVGIAIYCCLRNRQINLKYAEASDAQSAPSVFTSGTSQNILYPGAASQHQRKNGAVGSGGKYGSMEDVRSSTSSTQDRANNAFSNKAYEATDDDEKKPNRQGSYRREKGGQRNAAFDDTDAEMKGGHVSRRDTQQGPKYDKKKTFSRNEEYEMTKVNKMPNGILKTRSKSPDRSQSSTEGSAVDANALIYGYSATKHDHHPNTHHVPKQLERSRSRSRGRSRSGSRGPGSAGSGHSRKGSVGKSGKVPKTDRQYNDLSSFVNNSSRGGRPRSRSSGSLGRSSRPRSDSKNSDTTPSEVSFAPSGSSSKKTTGGRRVQIQGVESDI